jgi:hypothetical protein
VFESRFGAHDYLRAAADFDWPFAPTTGSLQADLRRFTGAPRSSAYTSHLMEPDRQAAYFVAFAPRFGLAFGYVWSPSDFPWMGIWEENRSRHMPPWSGQTMTRGMEFGVSPFPETREQMIARGRLFGAPCGRRIAAGATIEVNYCAVLRLAGAIPESLEWPA